VSAELHDYEVADHAQREADIGAEMAEQCQVCVWCAEYGELVPHAHVDEPPATNRADVLDIFDTSSPTTRSTP